MTLMTSLNEHPTVKMGGFFHQPDYLAAYHEAARLLMQAGRTEELAMPIIHLQRHTVELLLKSLLDGAQCVIVAMQEIQAAKGQPVLSFKVKNEKALKHHNLYDLLMDAEAALTALGWTVPVPGLRELVSLFQSVEQGDETRWRYAKGRSGLPSFPYRLGGDFVELPIHEIQQRLTQIAEEEQIGKTYEAVMKADSISSYIWSLALTNQQLEQELYSLGLL